MARFVRWTCLTLTVSAVLFGAACGDDDDGGGAASSTQMALGSLKVNDHGTTDAKSKSEIAFEADDFYFKPTFIRGNPGQKLTLKIENEGAAKHNLTIAGTVDKDIEPGSEASIEITFPQQGVLLFMCKYHTGNGMNGELLVGDAQPSAPPSSSQPSAGGTSTADSGYGY